MTSAQFAAKAKRERRQERNYRNEAAQGRDPEGLGLVGGAWMAECRSCGNDYVVDCDAHEFHPDYSYCGGSERCIP
ncbi:hypothetical protein [Pseudomonas sp. BF-B-25]|uniref:hypothetical protein n=1 Tax=Pseudomonas sp. BF-B-25 TaxID=2832355 RepID=UPI001CBB6DD8|nr:hypothetical protein [Pseudomonas sp. BF-B-25]